jgi:restriction endonuclease S subunit
LAFHETGIAQPHFNIGAMRAKAFPLPPIVEQQEIVRRVEALFNLADSIGERVASATARVETVTQSILAKAFRGELVPTEAELARREGRDYEPASVLLEGIKEEREAESFSKNANPKRTKKVSFAAPKGWSMSQLVTPYGTFNLTQYETEQEFERAVVAEGGLSHLLEQSVSDLQHF